MAIVVVEVLDHYSSSSNKPMGYKLEFIGRFIELIDEYLILESIKGVHEDETAVDSGNTSSYCHVLHTVIHRNPIVYLEEGDKVEELKSKLNKLSPKIFFLVNHE